MIDVINAMFAGRGECNMALNAVQFNMRILVSAMVTCFIPIYSLSLLIANIPKYQATRLSLSSNSDNGATSAHPLFVFSFSVPFRIKKGSLKQIFMGHFSYTTLIM